MLCADHSGCSELRETNLSLGLCVGPVNGVIVEVFWVDAVIYPMHFISFYIDGLTQVDLLLKKPVHLLSRQSIFCLDGQNLWLESVLKFADPVVIHIFVTYIAENNCFRHFTLQNVLDAVTRIIIVINCPKYGGLVPEHVHFCFVVDPVWVRVVTVPVNVVFLGRLKSFFTEKMLHVFLLPRELLRIHTLKLIQVTVRFHVEGRSRQKGMIRRFIIFFRPYPSA